MVVGPISNLRDDALKDDTLNHIRKEYLESKKQISNLLSQRQIQMNFLENLTQIALQFGNLIILLMSAQQPLMQNFESSYELGLPMQL